MTESHSLDDAQSALALLNHIHDWWFAVSEVKLDRLSRTLTAPLRQASRSDVKTERKVLVFQEVAEYLLEDAQGIESYDINRITWEPERGVITIATGIPTVFQVRSVSPHVSLTEG